MKRMIPMVTAATTFLLASSFAQASTIIWNQGSGGNGHAYEFVTAPLISWNEASAMAQAATFNGVNGHLATITSGEEQYFINSIPSLDPTFFPDAIGMWLGGFQANPADPPDQGWSWVTGEAWDFTNWAEGEPDDLFEPESHLAMYVPTQKLAIGWSDQVGAEAHWFGISGFLIEYAVPAPPTPALALFALLAVRGRRRQTSDL
jgi:hypothetical protein